MRTHAELVEVSSQYGSNLWRVVIETPSGFCVWPILYPSGAIAYDYPERVPAFIKPKVRRMLEKLRDEGKAPWSVADDKGQG